MNRIKLATAAALFLLTAAGSATAETSGVSTSLRDTPILPKGFAVQAGGGATGFFAEEARDYMGAGAYWEARATLGTRSFLGGEIAYVGSGRELAAQGLVGDSLLIGHGIEANQRLNLPLYYGSLRLAPFIFSGLGYTRYWVANTDYNSSIVKNTTNALVMPMGAGLGINWQNFHADLRFTYRRVIDDDMIKEPGKDRTDLQNWAAGISIGYEL